MGPVNRASFAFILLVAGCGRTSPYRDHGNHTGELPLAIHGFIVSEEGAKEGWVVVEQGKFSKVGCAGTDLPAEVRKIKYDGYIFPGLIDNHNHVHWNAIPKWSSGQFNSRYEWLNDPAYLADVNNVFFRCLFDPGFEYLGCKYGEIRALVGGTTLIQSTYSGVEPANLLIRNLDRSYKADAQIQNIRTLDPKKQEAFIHDLDSGALRRIHFHIGEGKGADPMCAEEFKILGDKGFHRKGVVVIHGIALTRADFRLMKEKEMPLVWSPRSNWVLYRETADVPGALAAGLTVALAPDWTITGSDNLLEEMKFAFAYTHARWKDLLKPKDLFRMATSDAAKVAGVDDQLGRIATGLDADFFLAPKLDTEGDQKADRNEAGKGHQNDELRPSPFRSLLRTYPRHIRLVFVGGRPIYGDAEEMAEILPAGSFDPLEVQASRKAIVATGPAGVLHSEERYGDIIRKLKGTLPRVAALVED